MDYVVDRRADIWLWSSRDSEKRFEAPGSLQKAAH